MSRWMLSLTLLAALATLVAVGGVGLSAPGTAEAARAQSCPTPTPGSTDLYVNPVVKRSGRFVPTGVPAPAECAFASITDAIATAKQRGLDAPRIILTGATANAPAVFRQETFPLVIPVGVTVTTTDDPAPEIGGAGLDPTRYVVPFTGRAAYAADLDGGGLAGVTLKNERARRDAAVMLRCGAGTAAIDAVTLDGAGTSGGVVGEGLELSPGCDLDASALRVRGFAGNGVIVEEGAELTLDRSKIHNNGGDGLTVRGVVSSLNPTEVTEIAFNGDDGILVEPLSTAAFANVIIRDNANNGIEVHPSNLTTFVGNQVYNNSRSFGWDEPQMLFDGPPTTGVPLRYLERTVTAYRVGDPGGELTGCDNPNRIFGFNVADTGNNSSVGIRAINDSFVDASWNSWTHSTTSQNVTAGDSSFVQAELICTPLANPPGPGPPVE